MAPVAVDDLVKASGHLADPDMQCGPRFYEPRAAAEAQPANETPQECVTFGLEPCRQQRSHSGLCVLCGL
jgi:hypothetical protein